MDYSGKIITKNPVEPSQTSAPGVWTLDQATQAVQGNNWPIAYVPNPISRSLRFNSADSAYLNRTFTTPTLSTKWTWNGWVKRSGLGASQTLFSASSDVNNWGYFGFLSGDTLTFSQADGGSVTSTVTTTQVFRDVGAWYCITIVFDTTQGTASNRLKMYVNGVQITAFGTASYLGSGVASRLNAATAHQLGRYFSAANYFSGYMTEINFIDGQALDASYFGMTDPRTGAWIPKKYSGTYGTNGFYLNFSDNASTAALGTDYSGNSNTWTTNNFSVTAGSGNDSMVDVPTPWVAYNSGDVGGVIRGNYATLNPLSKLNWLSQNSTITPSNGNLEFAVGSAGNMMDSTIAVSSGKWYWEVTQSAYIMNGIRSTRGIPTGDLTYRYYQGNGQIIYIPYNTTSQTVLTTVATSSAGDVIGMALDLDNYTMSWYKNGSLLYTATGVVADTYTPCVGGAAGSSGAFINFGQRPFAYTPPAGFKSLCTTNLPEPTILDGGDYFNAVLYTGNGGTQTVSGVGFQPDLVWIKNRQTTNAHKLVDAVRGAGISLSSNSTDAEGNESLYFTNFTSDGFDLALGGGGYNAAYNYVAWNWKANGAGSSNTAGTITSTVSVNQTAGFSIVTYTGDGTAGATIGHGLGATPSMMIAKNRSSGGSASYEWTVYHASLGATKAVFLNDTGAAATDAGYWYNTAPTSTLITVPSNTRTNTNGSNFVIYCFAPVAGYSAFGSYVGNGSADGPFVYTGFRPKYYILKNITSGQSWSVQDTARSSYNVGSAVLLPNSSNAEATGTDYVDILSNGFKIRHTSAAGNNNNSGDTYIYAAFAENPFKYSNAR